MQRSFFISGVRVVNLHFFERGQRLPPRCKLQPSVAKAGFENFGLHDSCLPATSRQVCVTRCTGQR